MHLWISLFTTLHENIFYSSYYRFLDLYKNKFLLVNSIESSTISRLSAANINRRQFNQSCPAKGSFTLCDFFVFACDVENGLCQQYEYAIAVGQREHHLRRCRISLIVDLNVVDNKMNVCASCTCKHVLVSYTYCKYMKYSENNSLLVTRRVTLLV